MGFLIRKAALNLLSIEIQTAEYIFTLEMNQNFQDKIQSFYLTVVNVSSLAKINEKIEILQLEEFSNKRTIPLLL